jgi:hypothetical protein
MCAQKTCAFSLCDPTDVFGDVVGEFSAFMPLPNCFELFGFDFLVDENLNPIILEVRSLCAGFIALACPILLACPLTRFIR